MVTTPDLIFALIIAIAFPIYALIEYRGFKRQVAAGEPAARSRAYVQTMALQWLLAAGAIGLWAWSGRRWADLGLLPSATWQFWASAAVTAVVAGFLVWQVWAIARATGAKRARLMQQLQGQLEPVKDLLPHDAREMRLFAALAITAGICEELLYRAYLIWFLAAWLGAWGWAGGAWGEWGAAVISTLIFAAAHLYQGPRSALKIILVGAAMAGLYLFSGCVWLPMLLHATVDLTSGAMGFQVLRRGEPRPAEAVPCAE